MALYLNKPVAYLEDGDFDSQGNLIANGHPKDVPTVVMIQTSWCPHCTNAKPDFQKFAEKYEGKIFCATIQADGERESEKALGKRLTLIKPDFRGFPDYVLIVNGKAVQKSIQGRSVVDLEKFAGI